jgi:rare lipoprotein A (peptidoglycan hydrolase)
MKLISIALALLAAGSAAASTPYNLPKAVPRGLSVRARGANSAVNFAIGRRMLRRKRASTPALGVVGLTHRGRHKRDDCGSGQNTSTDATPSTDDSTNDLTPTLSAVDDAADPSVSSSGKHRGHKHKGHKNHGNNSNSGNSSNSSNSSNSGDNSNNGDNGSDGGDNSNNGTAVALALPPTVSGSTGQFSGQATWFTQNGVAGACGTVNDDSTPLVALETTMYDGGAHCNQFILVTHTDTGKSVRCKVQDECPSCGDEKNIDLSTGAFSTIGDMNTGVLPITWDWN